MPRAVGAVGQADRISEKPTVVKQHQPLLMTTAASEAFAKNAIMAWFRGELAAANAIIDALCGHLKQVDGGGGADYESAFAAIHRRRLNWIPAIQMQKYVSVGDVAMELKKVAEKKIVENSGDLKEIEWANGHDNGGVDVVDEDGDGEIGDGSPHSENTDSGSQEVHPSTEHMDMCCNHEKRVALHAQIKTTKGSVAKKQVKGLMVNLVRGLKLYECIFTDAELSILTDFANDLRVAGRSGELSGETFISCNQADQNMKGNKRELIQLGVPIYDQIKEDATNKFRKGYIEPIPALLQGVIKHLIKWHLIPKNRKPNSCIINFFDEGDYSQPFVKPPHLDQPFSTLLLSESTMAFGHMLSSDSDGKYGGSLTLSLQEGSVLVMRGNGADTARHAMCSSQNKRVSITFFRVKSFGTEKSETTTPLSGAQIPTHSNTMLRWGFLQSPMVVLAPPHPVAVSMRRMSYSGTGVFLPLPVQSQT